MTKLDAIASRFREDLGFEALLTKYKAESILSFCEGCVALDLGCGIGMLTSALASRFERIIGVDGSGAKIARARAENAAPHIQYIESYVEDYSPAERFDTVVMSNILEHLQDVGLALGRVRGWLNVNGIVVATVPNAKALNKRIGRHLGLIDDYYAVTEADRAKGHLRLFDAASLRQAFISAGFTVRHVRGVFLKPLSNTQMEAWDASVCDALFKATQELPATEEFCSPLLIVAQR